MFESLRKGEHPRFWAAHLPVVSTSNAPEASFPIHSATKGVGLLPHEEFLVPYVAEINACLRCCEGRPPAETLAERIEVAWSFYRHPQHVDDTAFGTIEIFQGTTYRNIQRSPKATLLFTSPGPNYLSYQFNCSVELVDEEDPAFQFILGMRFLFEYERFHIQQPRYPMGYVMRVQEAYDKSPHQGTAGKRVDVNVARSNSKKAGICPFAGLNGATT